MSRPALHALLNGAAFVCLVWGWRAIRQRSAAAPADGQPLGPDPAVRAHVRAMATALVFSTVFLASYLEYHARVGHVPFWGDGALAVFYKFVLFPHLVLATVMLPMVITVVVCALRRRWQGHARWARRTWPIWIYVSASGVLIYVLNFALRPDGA